MLQQLKILLYSLGLFFVPLIAWANGGDVHEAAKKSISEVITSASVVMVIVVAVIVGWVVLISITKKEMTERQKHWLFWTIALPVIFVSLFVAGSTIYLNIISETKGPVHWHLDYRIFSCGEEIKLVTPTGLSNRTGSADFHDHGDSRLHVEGTVEDLSDVSLAGFFETVGGHLSLDEMEVPTDQGVVHMHNGEVCAVGGPGINGRQALLQVFLYRTEGDKVFQEKLSDWPDHIPAPHTTIPPGDCVIFEFTPEIKEQTDKICDFYAIELQKGNYQAANFSPPY